MSTREQQAAEYLENHKIIDLMDNLTSMMFFYRPERPREFLIEQLERFKISKLAQTDSPCLFNESNLVALFGILDPSHQGYITHFQYKEALKTLGVRNFNEFPDGAIEDKISQETFTREAKIFVMKQEAEAPLTSIVGKKNTMEVNGAQKRKEWLGSAATFRT